jgi:hypothetical protein
MRPVAVAHSNVRRDFSDEQVAAARAKIAAGEASLRAAAWLGCAPSGGVRLVSSCACSRLQSGSQL